jgi:hypothetical protein
MLTSRTFFFSILKVASHSQDNDKETPCMVFHGQCTQIVVAKHIVPKESQNLSEQECATGYHF